MQKRIGIVISLIFASLALWSVESTMSLGVPKTGERNGWSPYIQGMEGTGLSMGYKDRLDIKLSHAEYPIDPDTDLLLHFNEESKYDQTGNYAISLKGPSPNGKAYMGEGAGTFNENENSISLKPQKGALLFTNNDLRDFSIEFWLYPQNLDEGEVILDWASSIKQADKILDQGIRCSIASSRLSFRFENFFLAPDGSQTLVNLKSQDRIVPKAWGHHLLRYNSATGLVEYLVNGQVQATSYATSTGKERGTPYQPRAGSLAPLVVAGNFTGMIDELRITSAFVEKPNLALFQLKPGIAVTKILDLAYSNTRILKVEAKYSNPGTSDIAFYFRSGETWGEWNTSFPEWRPFKPNQAMPVDTRGRYLQFKVELFADGRGNQSPALSELTVHYEQDLPPSAPYKLIATSGDGQVSLRWAKVPETDIRGYLVYYGYAPGEYFGSDAPLGASPIDVGNIDSITIKGLSNGRLYYFSVAAYDAAEPRHLGGFSMEVASRPLRTGQ